MVVIVLHIAYCGLRYIWDLKSYIICGDNNFSINTNFRGIINKNENNDHFYKASNSSKGNVEGMNNTYIAAEKFVHENRIKIFNARIV